MFSTRFAHFAHFTGIGSRIQVALLLALAALFMRATTAAAHISVLPAEAPAGANTTFSLRVPTEQESPTVRVRVEFPAGVTVSRFQPKAGWQRTEERDGSGRITAATWSGGEIRNGEFDEFTFIARTPAEAGTLRFRAFQTYGAGETVEWINDAEPRPAATVNVRAAAAAVAAASGDHGQVTPATGAATTGAPGGAPAGATAVTAATASGASAGAAATARPAVAAPVGTAPASEAERGGSDLPLLVALGSGVVALVALALSALALMRRPTAPDAGVTSRAA